MTEKLPEFNVLVEEGATTVRLNGRKIGAAWGPAGDGTGAWFAYRYGDDPARFGDEKAAKSYLMGAMELPLPDWAKTAAPDAAEQASYGAEKEGNTDV